jgi:hypothetical protein
VVYTIHDYDTFKKAIDEICSALSSYAISSEKVYDCRLISHELIANVLQHSSGGAQLKVAVEEEYVLISVKAECAYCPPQKRECPEVSAERGRGIYLIVSVSAERTFTQDGEIVVKVSI